MGTTGGAGGLPSSMAIPSGVVPAGARWNAEPSGPVLTVSGAAALYGAAAFAPELNGVYKGNPSCPPGPIAGCWAWSQPRPQRSQHRLSPIRFTLMPPSSSQNHLGGLPRPRHTLAVTRSRRWGRSSYSSDERHNGINWNIEEIGCAGSVETACSWENR